MSYPLLGQPYFGTPYPVQDQQFSQQYPQQYRQSNQQPHMKELDQKIKETEILLQKKINEYDITIAELNRQKIAEQTKYEIQHGQYLETKRSQMNLQTQNDHYKTQLDSKQIEINILQRSTAEAEQDIKLLKSQVNQLKDDHQLHDTIRNKIIQSEEVILKLKSKINQLENQTQKLNYEREQQYFQPQSTGNQGTLKNDQQLMNLPLYIPVDQNLVEPHLHYCNCQLQSQIVQEEQPVYISPYKKRQHIYVDSIKSVTTTRTPNNYQQYRNY